MGMVTTKGVSVVRLPSGDMAVILTPSSAVMYDENTTVKDMLASLMLQPAQQKAIGTYVLRSTKIPAGDDYVEAIGQTLNLASYPDLQAALGGGDFPPSRGHSLSSSGYRLVSEGQVAVWARSTPLSVRTPCCPTAIS